MVRSYATKTSSKYVKTTYINSVIFSYVGATKSMLTDIEHNHQIGIRAFRVFFNLVCVSSAISGTLMYLSSLGNDIVMVEKFYVMSHKIYSHGTPYTMFTLLIDSV